ncbi:unnamed protein product [Onchocerca ochengi]|uniref:Activin_recp domain-containing protein n=1 Tax=Onchocerca ochengi TaxID=42157 RepID=A0A182EJ13_ONCOC|nr:unnamed protein product [Onchocerca ochengi]
MIAIVLVAFLKLCILEIEILPIKAITTCHFSRPSQASPTAWIDVIDECKESDKDAICFSGYNPGVAYFHIAVGWWRVLHTENTCFTKQYLRQKLACNDDEETPMEGCYRDKVHYKNFFLCWCTGSKCNTREKITQIYRKTNTIFIVGAGCKPLEF